MREKIRTVLEYALVLCVILEFNTPYLIFPLVKSVVRMLPIFLLLGLVIISNYSIRKRVNGYVLIYLVGAVFPMLIWGSGYLGFIKLFAIILPLIWIYLSLRKNVGETEYLSVFLKFSNVVVLLAVVSLFMWVFCSQLRVIPTTTMVPNEWTPGVYFIPTYYGIYFETQSIKALGATILRNTGIFNEGPMYNMVLCTALAIECFIRPIKSKTRISILAATILSTLTTTGELFLLLLAAYYVYKRLVSRYRVLLILVVPLLLLGAYIATDWLMETKMATGGESSVNKRSEDIQRCIQIGLEHPLMGVGLMTEEQLGNFGAQGNSAGFSNSLFTLFARGGIYILVLYIGALLFIPFLYYLKYKDGRWLLVMLCFSLIYSITISNLRYLTILFLAWGLSNIDLVRWGNQKLMR